MSQTPEEIKDKLAYELYREISRLAERSIENEFSIFDVSSTLMVCWVETFRDAFGYRKDWKTLIVNTLSKMVNKDSYKEQ